MVFFTVISCLSCSIYLIAGIYVCAINWKSPLHRNFCWFCLCFALWAFSIFYLTLDQGGRGTEIFIRLEYTAALIYEVFILRFFLYLTDFKFLKKRRHLIFPLLWVVPVIFLYQNIRHNAIHLSFPDGFWYIGLHVYANTYNMISLLLLFVMYRSTKIKRKKKQAKIIIISALFTMITTVVVDYLAGYHGVPSPTSALILVWIAAVFYAVIKYQMIEISPHTIPLEILNSIEEQVVLFDHDKKMSWFNDSKDPFFSEILRNCRGITSLFNNDIRITSSLSEIFNEEREYSSFRYPFHSGDAIGVYNIHLKRVRDSFGDSIGYLMRAKEIRSLDFLQDLYKVTRREIDVIKLLITGITYADISSELNITENTLKSHISNCYAKMGINNRVELVNIINNTENH